MDNLKIDILMPTYKPNADYLRAALDCVLAQTEENWRLYIVDEPTDIDTEGIVRPYLTDSRISYQKNERRLGIGGNWNRCLQQVSAPYIQFFFQDDLWNANYLKQGVEILEDNPEVGMVSLEHSYSFEGGTAAEDTYARVEEDRSGVSSGLHDGKQFLLEWIERGLHPNLIGEPSFVMLRKSFVDKAGTFRENMQQTIDSEYWTRMLAQANWYFATGTFGTFRVHGDSASVRNFESGTGIFERLQMLRSAIQLLPADKKERAQEVLQNEQKKMVEKFISRYGKRQIHIPQNKSLQSFLLHHPLILIKCVLNFLKVRKKVR